MGWESVGGGWGKNRGRKFFKWGGWGGKNIPPENIKKKTPPALKNGWVGRKKGAGRCVGGAGLIVYYIIAFIPLFPYFPAGANKENKGDYDRSNH